MNIGGLNSIVGLIILILDIIALVDLFRRQMDTVKKVLWAVAIILFPLLGMVLYFIINKTTPFKVIK